MNRPTRNRCAIYTRKSTGEGLEQDFNSLDAQREACSEYLLSHAGEGWEQIDERYDDGGWSGGSMERPAIKQLMNDVKAGRVDIIVVYKVDRLTRSLADFAKIVEILDEKGASFVSVSQAEQSDADPMNACCLRGSEKRYRRIIICRTEGHGTSSAGVR